MGRVARYKKIKDFDPYSKKNAGRIRLDNVGIWGLGDNGRKVKKRSKTAEKLRARKKRKRNGAETAPADDGFDMPPTDGVDDFDLADLEGSLKKEKPLLLEKSTTTVAVVTNPVSTKSSDSTRPEVFVDEDLKESKLLKVDQQVVKKTDVVPDMGRMEGETKAAYHRRVKAETRQIIRDEKVGNRNPERKKRKKEFLDNKKKKKKKGSGGGGRNDDASDDDGDDDLGCKTLSRADDGFVTGEQALAARTLAVKFGEQAERPPTFRQLPRGASKKNAKDASHTKLSNSIQIAAEQQAMELIRRKVQAQYAVVRAKRRQQG